MRCSDQRDPKPTRWLTLSLMLCLAGWLAVRVLSFLSSSPSLSYSSKVIPFIRRQALCLRWRLEDRDSGSFLSSRTFSSLCSRLGSFFEANVHLCPASGPVTYLPRFRSSDLFEELGQCSPNVLMYAALTVKKNKKIKNKHALSTYLLITDIHVLLLIHMLNISKA